MAQLWRDELGAEPGAAAQALRAQAEAMSAYDPARVIPNCGATRVPRPATQTVGRDRDISSVLAMLDRHRLVTLLGIGGVGKTRLAAEVAHRYVEATSERACYVDLTKVRDAGLVPELTVRELGIRAGENQDVVQMLEEALRRQSLLLVLDNFEHVVDAADLVGEMVRWSDDLRVLVTSRARLRVAGEKVFEVLAAVPSNREAGASRPRRRGGPLRAGRDGRRPAVRAGAARRGRRWRSAGPWTACPLAIEIAGGHLRTLPPPLLRQRLAGRLGSAAAAGRDLPDRQQTIPATIDWSLQLLGPAERRLFARLAVFHGARAARGRRGGLAGRRRASTRSACWSTTAWCAGRPATGPSHASGCWRWCGSTPPGSSTTEREAVAAAHAAYVAAFVEDLFERRWTDAADRWLDDITEMLPEVRAAHDWARRHGDLPLTARITAALGAYWFLEGHHAEGRRWVGEMLASEDELDPAVSARIRLAAGFLAFPRSQPEARRHWQRAAELFRELGETRLLAYALAVTSATYLGEHEQYARAMQINDEALALGAQRRRPRPDRAGAQRPRRAHPRRRGGRPRPGGVRGGPADLQHAIGDEIYVSVFLSNLSYLADHRGDYEEARRLTREALRICWSLGRRLMAAWTISRARRPRARPGPARSAEPS